MARHTVSWIVALRGYSIAKAGGVFPDDDPPRPRRPARKLAPDCGTEDQISELGRARN